MPMIYHCDTRHAPYPWRKRKRHGNDGCRKKGDERLMETFELEMQRDRFLKIFEEQIGDREGKTGDTDGRKI